MAKTHECSTWGLLAESAPRDYWPKELAVPVDLEREVWSETLYWASAFGHDERRAVEWLLCMMSGAACAIETTRGLETDTVSRNVFRIRHDDDPIALKAL